MTKLFLLVNLLLLVFACTGWPSVLYSSRMVHIWRLQQTSVSICSVFMVSTLIKSKLIDVSVLLPEIKGDLVSTGLTLNYFSA